MLATVGQLGINFITQHKQILLLNHLRDRLQIGAVHDRARWIVREWKNQHLCFRCDFLQQLLRRQTELILLLQLDNDRRTARQHRPRHIGNVTRLRNQNLIARIEHRAQGDINRLAAADYYHHFCIRIIIKTLTTFQIMADLLAQFL